MININVYKYFMINQFYLLYSRSLKLRFLYGRNRASNDLKGRKGSSIEPKKGSTQSIKLVLSFRISFQLVFLHITFVSAPCFFWI